jgi:hypothetical protein
MRIENAKITNVTLGKADHGIMTFWISVKGSAWGGALGGMRSDGPGLARCIDLMLDTIGVDEWGALVGEIVRVEHGGPGSTIKRIGHWCENKWVSAEELSEILRG